MKYRFADTSFFVALVNPSDSLHSQAVKWAEEFSPDILTTDYVLIELGNFLRRERQRALFVQIELTIRQDPFINVLPATDAWLRRGIELYGSRLDKEWSLTDCLSMVAMQDHGISEVLTSDHHFEQAGFKALLA